MHLRLTTQRHQQQQQMGWRSRRCLQLWWLQLLWLPVMMSALRSSRQGMAGSLASWQWQPQSSQQHQWLLMRQQHGRAALLLLLLLTRQRLQRQKYRRWW
jgi:hypothetical protein